MSTVAKGNELEELTFAVFSSLIKNNELPFVNGKYAKLYSKREYYSKDRESNIIVDMAIELKYENADKPSLVCVIECKNYSHSVPVNDVEEFYAKIDQILGKNTKGILVVNGALQEGAIRYAKAKGIAVLRISENTNPAWISYRESKDSEICDDEICLTELTEQNIVLNTGCVGIANGQYFRNIEKLFVEIIGKNESFNDNRNQGKHNSIIIPYISKEDIEDRVNHIVDDIRRQYSVFNMLLTTDDIKSYLLDVVGYTLVDDLNLGYSSSKQEVLGSINYRLKNIYVSKSLDSNNGRKRFTIAHEIGHLILHEEIFNQNGEFYDEYDSYFDNDDQVVDGISRMERQSNIFASLFLLPELPLLNYVEEICNEYDIRNRGHGMLYLDNQNCNLTNFNLVTSKIMNQFGVSRWATELRLKHVGILIDNRKKPNRIMG